MIFFLPWHYLASCLSLCGFDESWENNNNSHTQNRIHKHPHHTDQWHLKQNQNRSRASHLPAEVKFYITGKSYSSEANSSEMELFVSRLAGYYSFRKGFVFSRSKLFPWSIASFSRLQWLKRQKTYFSLQNILVFQFTLVYAKYSGVSIYSCICQIHKRILWSF